MHNASARKNFLFFGKRPTLPSQMGWKRITINLEPELHALAKKRAKICRQSVASYFASLLEDDVKRNNPEATPAAEAVKRATEDAASNSRPEVDPQATPKKLPQSSQKSRRAEQD